MTEATIQSNHPQQAEAFLSNMKRAHWHDQALWFVREKRDKAALGVKEWEALREHASRIKTYTLSKLPTYLEQFETEANKRGIQVHWAKDGEEHNRIIHEILSKHNVQRVVKSKSMLTEECHLNDYLIEKGMDVIDTDLGERIVQLANEPPSHIVLPAIHKNRHEVGELFHEKLNTPKGESDPTRLTHAARGHLREKFIAADAGITGVNFAIASTGGFVVCTNEGNADLGTALPPLHIAAMGLEKLVPTPEDLSVFLRLLARSATGQPVTSYTSHFLGPRPGSEMHVVIVDNGRTGHYAQNEFRRSLSCIRCGACLNTCPVYRRSGGYSYGYTIPGPIGINLAPHRSLEKYHTLPFASSLCGSCSNVCPVKINLHEQILLWRQKLYNAGVVSPAKRLILGGMGKMFTFPGVYTLGGNVFRGVMSLLPVGVIAKLTGAWGKQRDLPPIPKESFRQQFQKMKGHE
ncbi:MAG: lactate utilization protein [SAR324 cluster bacterium]|nr:lactate utilization protein [SAR324 cluster bacterium]